MQTHTDNKNFKLWSMIIPDHVKDYTDGEFINFDLLDDVFFRQPSWKNDWPDGLELKIVGDLIPADFFEVGMFMIISKKFSDFLQKEVPNSHNFFELLPIKAFRKKGKYLEFTVINFLTKEDVLDEGNSSSEFGLLSSVVLNKDLLSSCPSLFKVESRTRVICMSSSLCDKAEEINIKGVYFLDESDWRAF